MDTHITHCCKKHGCKYNDLDCHISKGDIEQSGPCEHCGLEAEGYYGNIGMTVEDILEEISARKNNLEIYAEGYKQRGSKKQYKRIFARIDELTRLEQLIKRSSA